MVIICVLIATFYVNDIGCINGSNIRCKINNNYTTIIVMIKAINVIPLLFSNFFNICTTLSFYYYFIITFKIFYSQ